MEIVAFRSRKHIQISYYLLFLCFSFRDRVVRTTPANEVQLNFLERLEDNDDVSSTLSKIQR